MSIAPQLQNTMSLAESMKKLSEKSEVSLLVGNENKKIQKNGNQYLVSLQKLNDLIVLELASATEQAAAAGEVHSDESCCLRQLNLIVYQCKNYPVSETYHVNTEYTSQYAERSHCLSLTCIVRDIEHGFPRGFSTWPLCRASRAKPLASSLSAHISRLHRVVRQQALHIS